MNKKIRIILFMLIVLLLIYIYYIVVNKDVESENISKIEINFNDFTGVYTFGEKENIDIALGKEKYLRTYISPKGTFGSYQTIDYKIFYDNGKVIIKKYENVYPVNEIFKDLFNSEEYKKQALYIFKEEAFEINKLTLYIESINNKRIEITNKELINNIIIALREYYLTKEQIFDDSDYNHINTIEVEFPKEFGSNNQRK